MASGRTQILISVSLAIALLVVALLFPTVILPLLPPVRPLAAKLLVRLRDVLAFLAFTTAIAVGIFSIQRKDAQSSKRRASYLEHHPLGSIFGEPGYGETEHFHGDSDEDAYAATKKMETTNGDGDVDRASTAMANSSLLQKRSAWLAMEAAREHNLPISKEENATWAEPKVQKKLHRKSSSLDDSVNYEPHEAARPSTLDSSPPPSTLGKNKVAKRVSFSVASTPASSSLDEATKQPREETAAENSSVNALSPGGDLTRQADAYIAKFKEQLRMQRLESFQRYRRRNTS